MTSNSEQLAALEGLFVEFNDAKTSNQHKHQIESNLNSFVESPDAWQSCLYFLEHTNSDYVVLFCCNVLETWIVRKWSALNDNVRLAIRGTLERLVLAQTSPKSRFARNKIAQALVFIGRSDWPAQYPSYLDSIFELCSKPDTIELGLTLVLLTSEEFNSTRDDLTSARRKFLRAQLGVHAHKLLQMLDGVLLRYLQQVLSNNNFNELPVAKLGMSCIAHLFSWIDIDEAMNSSIIKSIFRISSMAYDQKFKNMESVVEISNLSLTCIVELIHKRCIPPKYNNFIVQMFNECYQIMDKLVSNKDLMQDYDCVKNIIEFLSVLMDKHVHRLRDVSVLSQLIHVIVKFAHEQSIVEVYIECVDIWNIYLDKINTKHGCYSEEIIKSNELKTGILSFVNDVVLKKFLCKNNHTNIDEIDNVILDDENKTEWDSFLDPQIQVIVKTDSLYPEETFETMLSLFDHYLGEFANLRSHIDMKTKRFGITGELDCRNIHYLLKDFSSMVQLMGALAFRFSGKDFMKHFGVTNELLARFIFIISEDNTTFFYNLVNITVDLKIDFIDLHASTLSTLNMFCCSWMVEFYQQSRQHDEQGTNFNNLVTKILDPILLLYNDKNMPFQVIHAASHLILTIFSTLKPGETLLNNPSVKSFYDDVGKGKLTCFALESQLMVIRGLSDYLILPWSGHTSQQWDQRAVMHDQFASCQFMDFTRVMEHLTRATGQSAFIESVKNTVSRSLRISIVLIESLGRDGNSLSKQIVYASLNPVVECILQLLTIYVSCKDLLMDLLNFLVNLFNHLRVQMGTPFVDHTIQIFLPMFNQQQLSHMMENDRDNSSNIIEKFFDILTIIVQEPSKQYKKFIPNIIKLCLKQIYPIADQIGHLDTKSFTVRLLFMTMDRNWSYFFDRRRRALNLAPVCDSTTNDQDPDGFHNEDQFIGILEIFVGLFDQPELSLFEHSLKSIQNLNSCHQLYKKAIFKEKMMWPIITILLKILMEKSKAIYEEDILRAIYDLACIDFNVFYTGFLPTYLCNKQIQESQSTQILNSFTREQDIPSFIENLKSFVIDIRFLIILKEDTVYVK